MNLKTQFVPGMGTVASILARGGFYQKLNEHVTPRVNRFGEDKSEHSFTLFVCLNGKIKQATYMRVGEEEMIQWH